MKIKLPLVIAGAVLLTAAPAMAADIDLTAGGTAIINGATFITSDQQSTGTGVIQSFVRLSASSGDAEGYNATARPVMPDVNTSPTFTHDLLLSAVPEVQLTPGGTIYYEFLLDINQTSANSLLSLDELQIYTRNSALLTANTLAALTAAPSQLRYDLDAGAGGDLSILLDYNLNSGSGSGDLFVYIPKSLFGAETDFVYLYSMFGSKAGYTENDGFEEWAVRENATTTVPDGGATVTLLGSALLGLSALRRRFGRG